MSRYIKIADRPDLVRDRRTGAILNINTREIQRQKEILRQKQAEKQEIQQLKNDVGEIKSLLHKLLEKSNDG
jgi:DNA-binding transcriptional regulator GbsR (MarR family)